MFRTLLLLLLLVVSLSPNYPGVSSAVLNPNVDTIIPSTLYPIIYRLPENVRDIYRDETEKATLTSTLRQTSEPAERTSIPTTNSPIPSPKSTNTSQQQRPSQNSPQSSNGDNNNIPPSQQQQQELPRKQQQQNNIPTSSLPDSSRNQQQQQQPSQISVPPSSSTTSKEKNSSNDDYDTSETTPTYTPSSSSSSPTRTTNSSQSPSFPNPNRKAIVLILGVGAAVTIALVSTLLFFIRKKNKYSSSSTSFKNMLKPDDPYYSAKPSWADEVYIDPTTGEAFQPASDPPSSFRGGTSQPFRERVPTPDDYIPGYPPSSTVPEYATFASTDSKLSPENEKPYGNRPPRPPYPPFARQQSH